jgi:hypothetical protein
VTTSSSPLPSLADRVTQDEEGNDQLPRSVPDHSRPDFSELRDRRVAILLGAEAYQAHHVVDIALELARKGVRVEVLATLPDSLSEFSRLSRDACQPVSSNLLFTPFHLRVLQRLKLLGSLKTAVLRHPKNVRLLSEYDAIVTPTDHARVLRRRLRPRPLMIYVNHGIGGRAASYSDKYSDFDFVVVATRRDEERLLSDGRIASGHYVVAGYARLETARRLHGTSKPRLFANDRPVVLFNPHSKRALRSWDRFARPLIDYAATSGDFNLIVAPHVKLFGRRPHFLWKRWQRLAAEDRVIVDLGSPRSLDMTYALEADIYVGDVSSQLYEFLSEPKPCVFLNAHRLRWRNNRDFQSWRLGDVAETPADAVEAIRSAFKRHHIYRGEQADRIAEVREGAPGAGKRAADAILSYLNRAVPA